MLIQVFDSKLIKIERKWNQALMLMEIERFIELLHNFTNFEFYTHLLYQGGD